MLIHNRYYMTDNYDFVEPYLTTCPAVIRWLLLDQHDVFFYLFTVCIMQDSVLSAFYLVTSEKRI